MLCEEQRLTHILLCVQSVLVLSAITVDVMMMSSRVVMELFLFLGCFAAAVYSNAVVSSEDINLELKKELDRIEVQSLFSKNSEDERKNSGEEHAEEELLATDLFLQGANGEKRSVECKDTRTDCEMLKGVGVCESNPEVAEVECPSTCGKCKSLESVKEESCEDQVTNCEQLKEFMKCDTEKMSTMCPRTCQHCKDCEDIMEEAKCVLFRDQYGFCRKTHKFRARMEKICYKSCGLCRAPSPPKCQSSDFGCCWDNVTEKLDPVGLNCKPCINEYPHTCEMFANSCWKHGTHEPFMKKHCAKKCGFCIMPCKDDDIYVSYCSLWKRNGYCKLDYDIREHLCPVTCGTCVPAKKGGPATGL